MNRKEVLREINRIVVENKEEEAIELLCLLLEKNDNELKDLIYILIDNFQLYGYIKPTEIENFKSSFTYSAFQYTLMSYKGEYIKHLNYGQVSLLDTIEEEQKLIISAPTSFGKTSLLIEYIVKNNFILNNIIFIVPTNSLIEELYIKLLKINKELMYKYKITINISKPYNRNIRILTPERFLSYYEYYGIASEDLIIMDEAYKIESNNNDMEVIDNRALKFRKVIEILGKSNRKVIMLSPYTYDKDESMLKYMERYKVVQENRQIKYVIHNYYNLTNTRDFKKHFSNSMITYDRYNNIIKKTINILKELKEESNVVYINYPSIATQILQEIERNNIVDVNYKNDKRYNIFIKHLEDMYNIENIKEWYILSALKNGIGIYVASMPRYIKREIVNLFERDILKILIVTTAFIEGVNSCAKNIIVTSGYTGGKEPLNEMELLNISGRAGRFGKRYIGNVYFIDNTTYKKVYPIRNKGVKLSNPNYKKNDKEYIRNDYEIEMMEDEYLNEAEKVRKKHIIDDITNNNLDYNELFNICINVPMEWKYKLYNYFKVKNEPEKFKKYIDSIAIEENENVIEGIEEIFYCLREADIPFENKNFSNVSAFKRNGEFLWGILYKTHINGNIKKVLVTKKNYILSEKNKMDYSFFVKSWMNKYFNSKGEFQDNKLYDETFKFISNIIEYKIPYYIGLFVGIFNYYIKKEEIIFENEDDTNMEDIIEKIENMGVEEEMIPFYDYGFPKEMIDKISKLEKPIEEYNIDNLKEFDDYEKIMIKEFIEITKL